MSRFLPALALLFNAFVWGVSWYPFRILEGHGVHPLWATAVMYAIALLVLAAVRPGAWRGLAAHPQLWLLALAAGATNVGFNWAVTVGDVVRVVLLFYLMPVWTVLLAWPLLGERPGGRALARIALALAGVFIVLHVPGAGWPLPRTLPDWLAVGGGVAFALTNILLRRLRAAPADARVGAMFAGGFVLASATAAVAHGQGLATALPAPAVAWLLVALGLAAAFLLGNVALQYGAARTSANATALLMLSEVVFASVSAVLLGAAVLAPGIWVGGALVFAAALWSSLDSRAAPA